MMDIVSLQREHHKSILSSRETQMQIGVGRMKILGDGKNLCCGEAQVGPVEEVFITSLMVLFWFLFRTASGKAMHFV